MTMMMLMMESRKTFFPLSNVTTITWTQTGLVINLDHEREVLFRDTDGIHYMDVERVGGDFGWGGLGDVCLLGRVTKRLGTWRVGSRLLTRFSLDFNCFFYIFIESFLFLNAVKST